MHGCHMVSKSEKTKKNDKVRKSQVKLVLFFLSQGNSGKRL